MDFRHSDRGLHWQERVTRFLEDKVLPRAADYHAEVHADPNRQPPTMEAMKAEAREAGLWNMFLPGDHGAGLTNLEYAPLAELMGKPSVVGRGVQLQRARHRQYGSPPYVREREQQARWLKPLMAGEIRSAFLMTEPEVASSDATNIQTRIERDGDHYVINGRNGGRPIWRTRTSP
jgi:acyl-CoA dehydrogenase